MCNIGSRPTLREVSDKITIEVNIFNFNKDIYNKSIKLSFLKFIRNEIKFKTLSLLKKQLVADRNKCLEYCINNV